MAMWIFAKAIMAGEPIKLFNSGNMRRDFTYIDDVVEAVVRLVEHAPAADPKWSGDRPDPGSSSAPWRVYNIGNNNPVELLEVVRLLEDALGRKAKRELLPMQPGDVACHLCRCCRPHARGRFQAGDPDRRGHCPLHRLVSRLSSALNGAPRWRAGQFPAVLCNALNQNVFMAL